jgi:aminopeptidase N
LEDHSFRAAATARANQTTSRRNQLSRRNFAADGSGYRFLAEQTRTLDGINPQVAARLARCFDRWRRFDATRQTHARAALKMLRNHKGLSRDVFEIVERSLG